MQQRAFNPEVFDATQEPMFFGRPVGVARYDQQKYEVFERLIEKQLSFFWRPEEIDIQRDKDDFRNLPDHEKHIFISNLQYQTLLDSVQGRAPTASLGRVVSLPELETWIQTWAFSETIHSRSYTYILRNLFANPSPIFDEIVTNLHILARADAISKYYDSFIQGLEDKLPMRELKKRLYLCLAAVNVLEAIRFYVSFACSFAFAERGLMEGNAKIIKLIARDEALHLVSTQTMLQLMKTGAEGQEWAEIAAELEPEVVEIFKLAATQEKDWAAYLFKDGAMLGLNQEILSQYVDYITDVRLKALGLDAISTQTSNPIPWINTWLNSDSVQVAPQEVEISTYLVGQIDAEVGNLDMEL